MIHRYLAGTLVLVCVALGALAWRNRADPKQPWRRPLALLGLIVFQALLGMWTVTLLLKPLIVVAHLLRRARDARAARIARAIGGTRA